MQNEAQNFDERSAGGLVVQWFNQQPFFLLLKQLRKSGENEWVLPKGHIENGENEFETALREIFEETGLTCRILAPLGATAYQYPKAGTLVRKSVSWFLAEPVGTKTVKPGTSEGFIDHRWVAMNEAIGLLTHKDVSRYVRTADQIYRQHISSVSSKEDSEEH